MYRRNIVKVFEKFLVTNPRIFQSEITCPSTTKCLDFSFSDRRRCSKLTAKPIAAVATATSKDDARAFMAVFPDVVRDLTEPLRRTDASEAGKWFAKVLQYNVPNGKKNRGLAMITAYKMLMNRDLSEKELYLSHVLGWCVELLQAYLILIDDIIDHSQTRRGRPCWYKTNNLELNAINDGLMIETGVYQLLRKHFSDKSYYVDLVDLFHDINQKTVMGMCLEYLCKMPDNKPNLNTFTMARYNSIVKFKTSYYSFQLPVLLAMIMAGVKDVELVRQAKTILLEMGHIYQVQDDYLDCFGAEEVIGKVGTDISEGKCTWPAVVALQRFNSEQRAVMEECYGDNDPKKVQRIKKLYTEVGVPATFATYEEESYNLINTHIQQISSGLPHDIFFTFLAKIYRRSH